MERNETWWLVTQIEWLAQAGERLAVSGELESPHVQVLFEVIKEKSAEVYRRMDVAEREAKRRDAA